MRKFSFCGIFATLFVTTTIILLASCSQDDDCYESDMYTLAEMETRSGGGDPGGGQPSPVITNVDSITEFHEMYFFPNEVFNTYSSFVAFDPALFNTTFIEVDVQATLERDESNEPTVTSFLCSPAVMEFYPTLPDYMTDPHFGYVPGAALGYTPPFGFASGPISIDLSSFDFQVTNVYLQPDGGAIPGRYLLYATGVYQKYYGGTVSCTAFIPNHIYR